MNEIVIYREKPLSVEDFHKLDTAAGRFLTIREKLVSKSVPVVDNAGETYRWERALVPGGVEVFFRSEPDDRVMESLMRPATRQAVAVHLQRLYDHKPYARGEQGWQTVVEDLLHDLRDCPEWALLRTCEAFRLARGNRFFPDTADLVAGVRELADRVRWAYAARAKTVETKADPEPVHKDPPEERAKTVKMLHDAGFHSAELRERHAEVCVDCRMMVEGGGG